MLFTNQQGEGWGKGKRTDSERIAKVQAKFQTILRRLDVPVTVFVGLGDSHFRKPHTAMWETLAKSVASLPHSSARVLWFYTGPPFLCPRRRFLPPAFLLLPRPKLVCSLNGWRPSVTAKSVQPTLHLALAGTACSRRRLLPVAVLGGGYINSPCACPPLLGTALTPAFRLGAGTGTEAWPSTSRDRTTSGASTTVV